MQRRSDTGRPRVLSMLKIFFTTGTSLRELCELVVVLLPQTGPPDPA
jgi:hypothetical protein